MKKYGEIIYALLVSDASVVSAVGFDGGVPKVYPVTIPEGVAFPALVYTKSLEPSSTIGPVPYHATTCTATIYVMASSLDACDDIMDKVIAAMHVQATEVAGHRVGRSRWIKREAEQYDDTVGMYVIASHFSIIT